MNWIKRKLNDLFTTKRYYVVFYIATVDGGHMTSQITSIAHGHALNKESIINWIKEEYKKDNIRGIVFTNFIELSKSDFEDWTYEEPIIETKENGI